MYKLHVNGTPYDLELDPRTTLLDAVRDHIGLVGTKKGCDHGQCGACTVLLNGVRINSCLTLACMHDDDFIETVEVFGTADHMSELQKAFVDCDAYQCGYCTPGQICSATALIQEFQDNWPSYVSADLAGPVRPSNLEISERMSGNLCRCAAYPNIVEAIKRVVGKNEAI